MNDRLPAWPDNPDDARYAARELDRAADERADQRIDAADMARDRASYTDGPIMAAFRRVFGGAS